MFDLAVRRWGHDRHQIASRLQPAPFLHRQIQWRRPQQHLLGLCYHMITSHGFIIDSPSDARTLRRLIAHPTSADVEIPMYLLAHPMSDQKSATSDVFDSSSDVGLKVAASDQVLATSRRMRLRRGG